VRVLHVIPSLDQSDGGPSRAVVEICRASLDAGEQVEIAATVSENAGTVETPGIPTHLFPRRKLFGRAADYKYSPELASWLDKNVRNYDVLHIHAVFNYSTHAAARAAMRHGIPYIVRPLGTLNESYSLQQSTRKKQLYLRWIARAELDGAMALHCTSEAEAEDLRRLGLRPPKVVIPHGLRIAEFDAVLAERSQRDVASVKKIPQILSYGRIHPKKGFDLLLPALADLSRRYDFRLVVAGPGEESYVASLKAEAERRGISSRVVWAGLLSGAERWRPFIDSDIFVLPSYNENFGIAVAEAMACGLPVIVSDQVDLCIAVHDADAGLVVTCDTGELATAIAKLLDDPALRSRLGANGRRLVTEQFRWDRVAARLHRLYESARRGRVEGNE
jgi:glycosyltransferase involved in cell wall biosynthesis